MDMPHGTSRGAGSHERGPKHAHDAGEACAGPRGSRECALGRLGTGLEASASGGGRSAEGRLPNYMTGQRAEPPDPQLDPPEQPLSLGVGTSPALDAQELIKLREVHAFANLVVLDPRDK